MLPGRTDNAVKNRFHATERAKSRGKLDETFLNDPVYIDQVIKEALRVNGDLSDNCSVSASSVSSMDMDSVVDRTHPVKVEPARYATSNTFPVASASFPSRSTPSFAHAVSIQPFHAGANVEVEEEDDEEEDDDEEQEGDVNGLMELDIISFDSEDMDDYLDEVDANKCGNKFDLDCFNFDWNCSSFIPNNNNTVNPQNVNKTQSLNLCGLETWAKSSKPQNAIPMGEGEFIPKVHPQQPFQAAPQPTQQYNQHIGLNGGNTNINYNNNAFFYTR